MNVVTSGLVLVFFAVSSGVPAVEAQRDQIELRVRTVTIAGATIFSKARLFQASGLKVGQVSSDETLQLAQASIIRLYRDYGHFAAKVAIKRTPVDGAPADFNRDTNLSIEIIEGPLFLVRRIEFIDNVTTNDYVIRREVLLDEGKPYRESLLRESIRKINRLGIFERLSEKDVEIKTGDQDAMDPEQGVVDLRIHFKERTVRTRHKNPQTGAQFRRG